MTWQELAKTHEVIPYTLVDRQSYLFWMPWTLAALMIGGAIAGFYVHRWASR